MGKQISNQQSRKKVRQVLIFSARTPSRLHTLQQARRLSEYRLLVVSITELLSLEILVIKKTKSKKGGTKWQIKYSLILGTLVFLQIFNGQLEQWHHTSLEESFAK